MNVSEYVITRCKAGRKPRHFLFDSFPCHCYQKGEAGVCVSHAMDDGAEVPTSDSTSVCHHVTVINAETSFILYVLEIDLQILRNLSVARMGATSEKGRENFASNVKLII